MGTYRTQSPSDRPKRLPLSALQLPPALSSRSVGGIGDRAQLNKRNNNCTANSKGNNNPNQFVCINSSVVHNGPPNSDPSLSQLWLMQLEFIEICYTKVYIKI